AFSGGDGLYPEMKVIIAGMPHAGAKSLHICLAGGSFIESAQPMKIDWQRIKRPFEKIMLQMLPVGSQQ
ncbi:unnamed protein product, partial [Polarella glacialis]